MSPALPRALTISLCLPRRRNSNCFSEENINVTIFLHHPLPPAFELSVFKLGCSHPVLCAVIYQPPKFSKDFFNDFSELLAEIMPKYVLIVGDFNVHVCCPDKDGEGFF